MAGQGEGSGQGRWDDNVCNNTEDFEMPLEQETDPVTMMARLMSQYFVTGTDELERGINEAVSARVEPADEAAQSAALAAAFSANDPEESEVTAAQDPEVAKKAFQEWLQEYTKNFQNLTEAETAVQIQKTIMRQCMAAQPRFPVEAAPEVLADFVEFLASRSPPSGDLDELVAAQRRRPGDGEDSSEEEEALDEFGTMLMANRRRDQPQRRRH